MFTKKYILNTLLAISLCTGLYAQVGIGTTTTTVVVPSRTATPTTILDTSTTTLENALDINGNLRVAYIPSATTITKTLNERGQLTNTITFDTEDYKEVLVTDDSGNVNHLDLNDFYAFNYHYTRYVTMTATVDVNGADEEVVKGTIISIDWLDICFMYTFWNSLKYVEPAFRPNLRNVDSNGKQMSFGMSGILQHETLDGYRQFNRTYQNPTVTEWLRPGKGASAIEHPIKMYRERTGLQAKVINLCVFNKDLERWLIIDIYASISTDNNGKKTLSVTYWISQPHYIP